MKAAPLDSSRSLEAGARIAGKLQIVRRLAEGGMGTLWVARNLTTDAEVAIKVLRSKGEASAHEDAVERFRHEARLGAMLAHRNITRVYDLIEDRDGVLVLVMELLVGQSLEDYSVGKGPMPGAEAVELIVPVLGALQHAHEHGVVHRDMKPSNIFLHVDPDGHRTPKLLDFGVAKMRDASLQTRAGDVLGTPSYMSPEQVRAKPLDGRSDLFSIGVVLYELITGENPFRTAAQAATLARVLEMEVDPDPRIDPRLWLVIQRALSKQAYERQASAAELAEALSSAVGSPGPASARRVVAVTDDEAPTQVDVVPPMSPRAALPVASYIAAAGASAPAGAGAVGAVGAAPAGSVGHTRAAEPGLAPPTRSRSARVTYGVAALLVIGSVVTFLAWRTPAAETPKAPTAASVVATPADEGESDIPPLPTASFAGELPSPPSEEARPGKVRTTGPARRPRRPPRPPTASPPKPPPPAGATPVASTPGF